MAECRWVGATDGVACVGLLARKEGAIPTWAALVGGADFARVPARGSFVGIVAGEAARVFERGQDVLVQGGGDVVCFLAFGKLEIFVPVIRGYAGAGKGSGEDAWFGDASGVHDTCAEGFVAGVEGRGAEVWRSGTGRLGEGRGLYVADRVDGKGVSLGSRGGRGEFETEFRGD